MKRPRPVRERDSAGGDIMRSTLIHCLLIVAGCCCSGGLANARAEFEMTKPMTSKHSPVMIPRLDTDRLRNVYVHNAGNFYSPFYNVILGAGYNNGPYIDPETNEVLHQTIYPRGSAKVYIWGGAMWIGGIVDEDTLVSAGVDGWFAIIELGPDNLQTGGSYRTGHFADDEFVSLVNDTMDYLGGLPDVHIPMGLELTQTSYSWADTVYDDFIILDYVIRNIGGNHIRQGWVGFYYDCDIYHESQQYYGYNDDFSGCLDTFLYDDDPSQSILIPYGFDNNGDPAINSSWDTLSVTGVTTLLLLGSSFPVERMNFNWWISNGNPAYDYGPRHLGTPEDPLRPFSAGNLGTPVNDEDKYYVMSHPEIDYNQIEIAIHDSSDGWVPPLPQQIVNFSGGFDTRYLLSFGPFDLPPGDSITLAVAMVAAEGLHVNPDDWEDNFDLFNPGQFQQTLDFTELLLHCRRADSVFQSGYTLPYPGPPVGLRVLDYDDSYVTVTWHGSRRGDLTGYYLYAKDTVYSDQWNRVTGLLSDTIGTFSVFNPTHELFIGVSLVDTLGRESETSFPALVVPGRPHPPNDLAVTLDSLIPVITWTPHDDTALLAFMIYRSIWEGPYQLYDSTAALTYRDYGAESGVQYNYMVRASNILNLESDPVGPVTALPMALNRKILYCNLNRFGSSSPPPFQRKYLDHLFESMAALTRTDILNVEYDDINFKTMAGYELLIIDQSDLPRVSTFDKDSMTYYLGGGGKAVFLAPSFGSIYTTMRTTEFADGDFYHDFLKLDSAVTNAYVLHGDGFLGDLYACSSLVAEYPHLYADPVKIDQALMNLYGYIPLAGFMFPTDEAEPIYSYISSNPDTAHHGAINGIRYLDDNYGMVLLSFPLMAMEEEANFYALKQALVDLGIDMGCGDADDDAWLGIGDIVSIIAYLYRGGTAPASPEHADIDCSGDISLADAIGLVNYIFRHGQLHCCP